MKRSAVQPAWLAAAVIAVIVGVAGTWVSIGPGRFALGLFHLLTGWMMAGSGLVAWRVAPSSRIGPLLVAAGIALFIGDFAACLDLRPFQRACLRSPALAVVAGQLAYLWTGFLAHALLTYPDGRVAGRAQGVAVGAGYAASLLAGVWQSEAGATLLVSVLALATVVRWLRSEPRLRPQQVPGLLAASAIAGVVGAAWIVTAVRSALTDGDPFLASLALGMRSVTPLGVLPGVAALASLGLAAALAERAGHAGRVADRVVELGETSDEPLVTLFGQSRVRDVSEDVELLAAVERATELFRANDVLQAEAQVQLDEVLDSRRRLADAGIEERRDLEARLHEGAERHLAALAEELEVARVAAGDAALAEVAVRITRASEQLVETRREVRELAQGLHPRVLDELGLPVALAQLSERSPVPVDLRIAGDLVLEGPAAVTAWFVANEALTNGWKHAGATGMSLQVEAVPGGGARLTVTDDGEGGAAILPGGGLDGIRVRVEVLGGHLVVDSRPSSGTRLIATIPGDEARSRRAP